MRTEKSGAAGHKNTFFHDASPAQFVVRGHGPGHSGTRIFVDAVDGQQSRKGAIGISEGYLEGGTSNNLADSPCFSRDAVRVTNNLADGEVDLG